MKLSITKLRRFIAESVSEKFFTIGQYLAKLPARRWLSRTLVRLATTLLIVEQSARPIGAIGAIGVQEIGNRIL